MKTKLKTRLNTKLILTLILTLVFLVACSKVFKSEPIIEKLDFRQKTTLGEHYNRGKYIYNSVGSCSFCHAGNIKNISARNVGVPKVTGQSVDTIVDYFRSSNQHAGLKWASNYDLRSLATFLLVNSPASVKNETEHKEFNNKSYFTNSIKGYVNHPKESTTASYGRYLTLHVAPCASCHNSRPKNVENSLDKDITGLEWSSEQFLQFFKTGNSISSKDCAWSFIQKAEPSDQQAISYYLESLN